MITCFEYVGLRAMADGMFKKYNLTTKGCLDNVVKVPNGDDLSSTLLAPKHKAACPLSCWWQVSATFARQGRHAETPLSHQPGQLERWPPRYAGEHGMAAIAVDEASAEPRSAWALDFVGLDPGDPGARRAAPRPPPVTGRGGQTRTFKGTRGATPHFGPRNQPLRPAERRSSAARQRVHGAHPATHVSHHDDAGPQRHVRDAPALVARASASSATDARPLRPDSPPPAKERRPAEASSRSAARRRGGRGSPSVWRSRLARGAAERDGRKGEDAAAVAPTFTGDLGNDFYAVYDGHRGRAVASHARARCTASWRRRWLAAR